VQKAGFLVVDLYRQVLFQIEIPYFGYIGGVIICAMVTATVWTILKMRMHGAEYY